MNRRLLFGMSIAASSCLAGALIAYTQNNKESEEQERTVKAAEVPAVVMAALKKIAGETSFTEFAEEIEHGHKFYEGSWKGPDGNVDALVTESGDLVEIEESIPADKVPAAVRAAAQKEAGNDGKVRFEKKTLVLYEIKFKKDGKGHERIFTADARSYDEGSQDGKNEDGDDEEEK